MVTIAAAQSIIFRELKMLPAETVPLLNGLGRIIREDLIAPWDLPSSDNSAMDGYAFSHAALKNNTLRAAGFLPAGEAMTLTVPPGEAVRIMTGAPVPDGCDTVVPLENVTQEGELIRLNAPVRRGDHIRCRGDDVRAGDVVISAGSMLRPQEIGMLASMGRTTVTVFRKPRVAVLATGDELVEPGTLPGIGKIIDSNSLSMAAQIMEAGCEPVLLGIAPDGLAATQETIKRALAADVVITTGGVSVGDRDYVKEAIAELGGTIHFWKVNIKPGKPVAFGTIGGKPLFALPGNPVAAMVTFETLVRPALLRAMGHQRIFRPVIRATLEESIDNRGSRPHLVRCLTIIDQGRYFVTSTGNQSSARIASMTGANGFMVLPPEISLEPGAEVNVMLLDRRFEIDGEFPL